LRFKRLKRLRDRENYLRDTKKIEPDPATAPTRVYNSVGYTIFSQQGFYRLKICRFLMPATQAPYIYPVILIPCNPPWYRVCYIASCPPAFTGYALVINKKNYSPLTTVK